jgi:hemoglobin/transferrin/lactoferrin receptor protein
MKFWSYGVMKSIKGMWYKCIKTNCHSAGIFFDLSDFLNKMKLFIQMAKRFLQNDTTTFSFGIFRLCFRSIISLQFLVISFIIMLFIDLSYAQAGGLNGIIKDVKTLEPVSNVNIILTKVDSEIIKGTSSSINGAFEFNNLIQGYYTLNISHIGYAEKLLEVFIIPDTSIFIEIFLAPKPVSLGEILVTSTKFIRTISETPLPLTTIERETVERSPALTPSDLLKNEPGISITRDGIWQTFASVRGLSRSNLVYLVDGNRIETATELAAGLSLIDVSDIKRIEVIKGSASSLYGSGALGGVINLITEEQSYSDNFRFGFSTLSGYNSVNNGGSGWLSSYLRNENWFVNISSSVRNADNTETPRGTLNNSQYKTKSISFSSGLKLHPNHELKINYQNYNVDDVGLPGGYPLFPLQAIVTYKDASRIMYGAEYNFRNVSKNLSKLSLKYFNQYISRDVENIPGIVNFLPASGNMPPRRMSVLSITPVGEHRTNSIQLQSNWVLNDNYFMIAGIDVWQRNIETRRERNILTEFLSADSQNVVSSSLRTIGEKPVPDASFRSAGVFVQNEVSYLNKQLTLDFGGRFDLIKIENEMSVNPVYEIVDGVRNDPPSSQQIIWEENKAQNTSWSANAGLLYKLTEKTDLTLNIASSFRSPSLEERYEFIDLGNLVRLGNPNLEPEQGQFVDLGFRYWGNKFNFRSNVFLNHLSNLVSEKSGEYEGKSALIKTNIGKARLYGFEAALEYNLLSEFHTYFSAAYVRGEDIEKGTDLPQIPPLNGRFGIKFPLINLLNFEIASSFFLKQDKAAESEIETAGYVLFDFYLSTKTLRLGNTDLQIFSGVENLTDKAYRNHLSTNRGLVAIEPGRNFFIKLKLGMDIL